jgi:uncharacterized protein YecE (DUF72 family)
MLNKLYIGTSGWSYPEWRQSFYAGIARENWLKFYSEHFPAVEINGSFYRFQHPATLQRWFAETPEDFRFVIKANRYLTHYKKLIDPKPSILLEKQHAEALQHKLAVVLWQLPASLEQNLSRLNDFIDALRQLWPEVRQCIEFRHESWFDQQTASCLAEAGIAVCQSDALTWPIWEQITAGLVYIRLHGHERTYYSSYSDKELGLWAERIGQWLRQGYEVHVYFDNTADGAAPVNANALKAMCLPFLNSDC